MVQRRFKESSVPYTDYLQSTGKHIFVFACDQCGGTAMGESVAVDPMGVAFAAGNEREELIPVYVDTDRIKGSGEQTSIL